jgi:hypothetical protein
VSHLGASDQAVSHRHEPALPGAVILPRWVAGSPTRLEVLSPDEVFPALAFNAFNYATLGAMGFESVVRLALRCPAWRLAYSDLAGALNAIDALWPEVVARHAPSAQDQAGLVS